MVYTGVHVLYIYIYHKPTEGYILYSLVALLNPTEERYIDRYQLRHPSWMDIVWLIGYPPGYATRELPSYM